MKTKEKIWPVASCTFLMVFCLLNIIISFVSCPDSLFDSPDSGILSVLIGVILIIGTSFLKEEYLYKFAMPIYIVINVLLVVQLIFEKDRIYMFGFTIAVASLLPLLSVGISKSIYKYNVTKKYIPYIIILIPLALTLFQMAIAPATVFFIAFSVALIIFKCEKTVKVSWRIFALSAILIILVTFKLYLEYGYFYELINICITRGKSDPHETGFMRIVIDEIFKSSKLIGATSFSIYTDGSAIEGTIIDWGYHRILTILSRFGIIPFTLTIILYICFYITIFKMAAKTTQSRFARNTSLFLCISLASQSFTSLVSLLFFYRSILNFPFLGSYTINCINFISYGVILILYLRRNEPSVIDKTDKNKESDNSIVLIDENGDDYKFEVLDFVYYQRQVFICLTEPTENDEPREVIILKIVNESAKLLDLNHMTFLSVDDDTLQKVFSLFIENNKEYYFVD